MAIEPNGSQILVRPWTNEDRPGKIALPEQRKKIGIRTAQVVAVGPGVYQQGVKIPMASKVGDTIMYDARVGTELRRGHKVLLFLHDSQVMAFVRVDEETVEAAPAEKETVTA